MHAAERMSKNLNISAQKATEEIFEIFGMRPVGAQGEKVAQAIEQVIVNALTISVEHSTGVAKEICSSDHELYNKIAEEISIAHKVLITNLSAMR